MLTYKRFQKWSIFSANNSNRILWPDNHDQKLLIDEEMDGNQPSFLVSFLA